MRFWAIPIHSCQCTLVLSTQGLPAHWGPWNAGAPVNCFWSICLNGTLKRGCDMEGLTERIIRDAKPDGRTRYVWDSRVSGFGLRIAKGGALAYVLQFRADGRTRRVTLGPAGGETSLKAARAQAAAALAEIAVGIDPFPSGADTVGAPRRVRRSRAPKVSDGIDLFFSDYVERRERRGRISAKTASNYRSWAKRIRAALGSKAIASVTRRDVERMLDGSPTSPETACFP